MEKLAESAKSGEPMNFLKYVFDFDEENKAQIMNLFQYTVLAIIPVILTLKAIKYIIPEEDESKGSLEILGECVGQLLLILSAIWISNRMIRYIPTYSKYEYSDYDPISFILPFLIILSTMQTKFGAKLNILFERAMELWRGKNPEKEQFDNKGNNVVKVSQPLANNGQMNPNLVQQNPMVNSPGMDTSVLPPPGQIPKMGNSQPDFSGMYQQQPTGMPNSQMPGMDNSIMAANESTGSPFGGSPW